MRLPLIILSLLLVQAFPAFSTTLEARSAFKEAYELFQKKEYYAAIESYKLCLNDTSFPLLDYSYYYIARSYQEKHNSALAIQVYDILLRYYPNSRFIPGAIIEKSRCYYDLNNYPQAERLLKQFLSEEPKHDLAPQARYLLGVNLEKQGKNTQAISTYQNLNLLHGDSYFAEQGLERLDKLAKETSLAGYEAPAASVYNWGLKYFMAGNFTKAKEYFTRLQKYYKKSSFHDDAILMLGRILLRKGKSSQAISYFKQVINLDQDSKPEAMYYLGRSYSYADSSFASAIAALEKLVAMYPTSHIADDAYYYLGYYHKRKNHTDAALTACRRLIESYPNSDYYNETLWLIGNAYYKQNNYTAAYDNFKEAAKATNQYDADRLNFWLGKAAEKLGKSTEAIEAYKTTIKNYDHSYYAYRAREKLNIKAHAIPDIPDKPITTNGESEHERKYQELLALDLADEAIEEAAFIEEKAPAAKKEMARLAQYHAYVMKGKFSKPINFAEKEIYAAMEDNSLASLDPKLWSFAYPRGFWQYVEKYSLENGLDPHLVYAVIREESRFQSRALSHSSAHGLMQIIPGTGKIISNALGLRYSRWNMYDPRVNIQMGTYYLASLIKRFDGNVPLALAGYNGGPVRVKKWLNNYDKFDLDEFVEDIPISETRNYVKKVMKSYYGYKRVYSGG